MITISVYVAKALYSNVDGFVHSFRVHCNLLMYASHLLTGYMLLTSPYLTVVRFR